MTFSKPSALVKPTLNTRFHIDYDWWDRSPEDLRYYLLSHLRPEQRARVAELPESEVIDYIDPQTGEVHRMDAIQLAIHEASQDPEFIDEHTSLVDIVFRVLLKFNNRPMTPVEIAEQAGRDAETILKTIGGRQIYKGIRPA
jgi:hypothetical protein